MEANKKKVKDNRKMEGTSANIVLKMSSLYSPAFILFFSAKSHFREIGLSGNHV
jgi:hypothetical protein